MTNKEFYDEISIIILEKCINESDFIEAYKKILEYDKTHDVKPEDTKEYFDSGASEMLAMATQRYRRNESKDKED